MTTSNSINPLGSGETDQIDPVVAEALTPYQIEWLSRQCKDLGLKRLQILRQALFEWINFRLQWTWVSKKRKMESPY
jgi:hypothetical protein